MDVKELTLPEALEFTARHNTKLLWLGREPADYISTLLDIDHKLIVAVKPADIIHASKEEAKAYTDSVFVCYHGISSHHAAQMLKEKFGIESASLKGGVTEITGEIFG